MRPVITMPASNHPGWNRLHEALSEYVQLSDGGVAWGPDLRAAQVSGSVVATPREIYADCIDMGIKPMLAAAIAWGQ